MTPPSIKGSIFARAIEDTRKLVDLGRLQQEDLERWLDPSDLEYFDRTITMTEWCPVRTYDRVLDLLRDVAGDGDNDYLRGRGANSAESLLNAGLYQQLEYLNRAEVRAQTDPVARYKAFGRDLRLLTTLSASILNFSTWTPKRDPNMDDRYVIEISDAIDFPDTLCWTCDGFINRMARQHGEPDLWGWERVRADFFLFRMIRAL